MGVRRRSGRGEGRFSGRDDAAREVLPQRSVVAGQRALRQRYLNHTAQNIAEKFLGAVGHGAEGTSDWVDVELLFKESWAICLA